MKTIKLHCIFACVFFQRGDRRVGAWRRCVHRAIGQWRNQRQPDGVVDYDQCLQNRISESRDRRYPMLPVRQTRQKGQSE